MLQYDVVRQLAAMTKEERQALKRRVLALFRRAEMRCLRGKLDDKNSNSRHNPALNGVLRIRDKLAVFACYKLVLIVFSKLLIS